MIDFGIVGLEQLRAARGFRAQRERTWQGNRRRPMSIRLEPDVKAALQELADADDRSLSSLINRVLRQYVESARKRGKAKA